VSFDTATERKLLAARRWETQARCLLYGAVAAMPVAFLAGHPLLAIGIVFIGTPAAWIFNLRCERYAWLVYRQFGTADPMYAKDQFLAPGRSTQLWKQPDACTKCGYPFRSTKIDLKAALDAQTHSHLRDPNGRLPADDQRFQGSIRAAPVH
jgi:hypothetical protein